MALRRLMVRPSTFCLPKKVTISSQAIRGFSDPMFHLWLLEAFRMSTTSSTGTSGGYLLRAYATVSKSRVTTKKATTKKKKSVSKKKPEKKKVAKNSKSKKPAKPKRPKVLDIPSRRSLSGYQVFLQSQLKAVSGPGAANRLQTAVAEWRALSDDEKQVSFTRCMRANT